MEAFQQRVARPCGFRVHRAEARASGGAAGFHLNCGGDIPCFGNDEGDVRPACQSRQPGARVPRPAPRRRNAEQSRIFQQSFLQRADDSVAQTEQKKQRNKRAHQRDHGAEGKVAFMQPVTQGQPAGRAERAQEAGAPGGGGGRHVVLPV